MDIYIYIYRVYTRQCKALSIAARIFQGLSNAPSLGYCSKVKGDTKSNSLEEIFTD